VARAQQSRDRATIDRDVAEGYVSAQSRKAAAAGDVGD
jgi:hypothetical protein